MRREDSPADIWLFQGKGSTVKSLNKAIDCSSVAGKLKKVGDSLKINLSRYSMR
ncbi:MAG: hypothetical protein OFPI_03290 [Osedax symbiont Rs2]|nr:MAG: hypothetical protein OFPI_03290 [Osedax symbiont Rs2]